MAFKFAVLPQIVINNVTYKEMKTDYRVRYVHIKGNVNEIFNNSKSERSLNRNNKKLLMKLADKEFKVIGWTLEKADEFLVMFKKNTDTIN